MFCTQCGHRLAEQDTFCSQCGAKRPADAASRPPDDQPDADHGHVLPSNLESYDAAQARAQAVSHYQPVWHFVLLIVATFSIYAIYWFYRNWKQLKAHNDLNISPGWKTVSFIIPIWGFVPFYGQLRYISNLARDSRIEETFSPGKIILVYAVLNVIGYVDLIWDILPDLLSLLLSGLLIVPLAFVQRTLNAYWLREQEGIPRRESLSGGEIALVAVGGIIWALFLLTFWAAAGMTDVPTAPNSL